jgi:glycine betaine/choline ABC-type transport system substrate-binding protein
VTRSLRLILAALAALVLALGATACGSDDDEGSAGGGGGGGGGGESAELIEADPANEGKSITIGSKNFTEQFILGEIYAQALEAAGFTVEKDLNLGSEQVAYRALRSGQVDAYPEYTGTSLTSFFELDTDEVPKDPQEAYQQVKREYAEQDITALPITDFENTYRIAATTAVQEDLLEGAQTVSEVAELPNAGELRIAGFPECRQRTDCLLGINELYGWEPQFISTEAKYEPLDGDQADLSFVFSTDGELALDDYAVIEDDQDLFPPYNISLGIRNDALERIGPGGREVLEAVQEPLTIETMQELNSRVDIDKQEPEQVAADYLQELGFTE